jgi:hypothetical protein
MTMKEATGMESKGRNGYRVVIFLLVALAAISSASKDLERLQRLTNGLTEFTARLTDSGLLSVSAAGVSAEERACLEPLVQTVNSQDFKWNGKIGPGSEIEIKGLNGDISAEPSSGSEVEVIARKHSRRSDVNLVSVKVVEHPGGVTICAIYPTEDPNQPMACEPGSAHDSTVKSNTSRSSVNIRNNDVQVDFKVKIPAGVNLRARTVNGEISAEALSGNVVTATVNGSISVSTSGFAEAKTVNGEISARLGNANWTGALQFKTVNGGINIDLPAGVGASVQAKTFNGEISSDFPLTILGKFSKRELSGTIGSGGRELILKTLNGSINLRRAG